MINNRLSRIELFAFSSRPSFMHHSEPYGCWYGVLKLTCGQQICYSDCVLCAGDHGVDLIKWGSFLKGICHCTIEEAADYVRLHGREWNADQLILLKTALDSMFISTGHIPMKSGDGADSYLNPATLITEAVSYYSLLS
ncbi:hypothetical protein [Paenibacillus typhae]|uniref:Uncharacterized protein n=1 Tax=Paenibacillus typhae TaxID=1174501 RepID=A0A1G8FJG5_9BACL|nr:hypothetical protein [Paenibacillus typhae]MBY0013442.1 hypothetical protein [Paenibacillus typhae]SDH82303.1 hypothetical protein SAMN05216192_101261 [Paenibacillus typhae]